MRTIKTRQELEQLLQDGVRDFSYTLITGVNLDFMNLEGITFEGSVMDYTSIRNSNLTDSNFTDVKGFVDTTGSKMFNVKIGKKDQKEVLF